jgi:hypothetical protein
LSEFSGNPRFQNALGTCTDASGAIIWSSKCLMSKFL